MNLSATEGLVQQAFGKIANFVVNSRLHFARNFIFNRKYKVPKFATSPSRGTLADIAKNDENIDMKRKTLKRILVSVLVFAILISCRQKNNEPNVEKAISDLTDNFPPDGSYMFRFVNPSARIYPRIG